MRERERKFTHQGLKDPYIYVSLREVVVAVVFHKQSRVIADQTVPVVTKTKLSVLATCCGFV